MGDSILQVPGAMASATIINVLICLIGRGANAKAQPYVRDRAGHCVDDWEYGAANNSAFRTSSHPLVAAPWCMVFAIAPNAAESSPRTGNAPEFASCQRPIQFGRLLDRQEPCAIV